MKVAVLGFGTVGKGVKDMIENSEDFSLGYVLVRPGKESEPYHVSDIKKITEDKSIDAVVECMGGVDVAFEYSAACLNAGKSVVSSNKALIAAKGIELQSLAKKNNCGLLFSAACGGAIPVLHNISIAKQTDSILNCMGIINGTTNYILSGIKDGTFKAYSDALAKAQELGYAEADPAADVSGLDTLRKVVLISAVAFDILPSEGLYNEGIENIDLYKDKEVVKLVGQCGLNKDGSVYAYVEPMICSDSSPLKNVNSNFNQIMYKAKNAGLISLFGQGAGKYPTASAVMRDLSELQSGSKYMISDSCIKGRASNESVIHSYVVYEGNQRKEMRMSVAQMHEYATKKRNDGMRVFFAASGEQNA